MSMTRRYQSQGLTVKDQGKNSRTPLQQRSIARVDAILSTSLELFGESGISDVSIKDIAIKAQITPSSIYQYFKDKRAIINALGNRLSTVVSSTVTSYEKPITSMKDLDAYVRFQLNKFIAIFSDQPGWILVVNELRAPSLVSSSSYRYTDNLVEQFIKNFSHLVNDHKQDNLFELCLWWGHVVYASLLFSPENKSNLEFAIDHTVETLIKGVQELNK